MKEQSDRQILAAELRINLKMQTCAEHASAAGVSRAVYVYPFISKNPYIKLMNAAIESAGFLPLPVTRGFLPKVGFTWLNWFENIDARLPSPLDEAERKIMALRQLSKGTKLIWTMHNRRPHLRGYGLEYTEDYYAATRYLMRTLADVAWKIVVHSWDNMEIVQEIGCDIETISPKLVYIPHPAYTGRYGERRKDITPPDTQLRLLFLGRVDPYKKLELLIDAVKESALDNIHLTLCGRASDERTAAFLRGKSDRCASITTDFRFIPDGEIAALLAENHIVVLPYDKRSFHNSGAALMAFSYGRTVLMPMGGALDSFNDQALFFSYTYNDDEEHRAALKEYLIIIHDRYKDSYNDILALGERCREYVAQRNDIAVVSGIIKEMLEEGLCV